jgi:hypothetical protein
MRLARPALRPSAWTVNQRLRAAGRTLAPLADADAMVQLLGVLTARRGGDAAAELDAALRPLLVDRRDRIARAMTIAGGRASAVAELEAARGRVERWRLRTRGFDALAGGLQRTVARARRASLRALERPTGTRYHAWRQRVKDLWLQVRLLERRTGGHLADLEARPEELDGVLGQYHDCTLLTEVVLTRVARTRRAEAAACLRLIRAHQRDLRGQARTLAIDVHRAAPAALVAHVRRLWRAARTAAAPAGPPRLRWPDAA